ncbi:MAG TPA: PEGA domain-containing protein [Polyangia bacterium]|nr:PEGA domain-containing protein [Polyangia bacterium]
MRSPLLVCLMFAAVSGAARAAEAPGDADAKAAAHVHFDKGLAASNEQRFGEAEVEFEKAYQLWPDFRVLYNIGKVRVALGRAAEAVDALQAYLAQGGDQITEERRREVGDAVALALARVATLTVRVSPAGAEVRVDGRLVGVAPLAAPVRVTEGKHTVEALLPDRPVQLRELDVPGASTLEVALDVPVAAKLEAPAPAPLAPVLVDQPGAREPGRRRRVVGYGLAGAGLAATVAGVVVAYEGASDANAARARLVDASMPAPPAAPSVTKYDAAKTDFDNAKTRNQLGWALVSFGVAAIVGGGALVLVASGSSAGVGGTF